MSTSRDSELAPDDETRKRRLRWLRRLVWVILATGLLAFLIQGANNPPDPSLAPEDTTPAEAAATPDAGRLAAPAATTTSGGTATGDAPPTNASPAGPAAPSPTAAVPGDRLPTPAPTTPTTLANRRPLPGFGEIQFRIAAPSTVTDGVALLADDGPTHSQGLMEQRDLRGYDGMIFRFDAPSTGRFFMRNTRIPLSIAFFDPDGRFVSSADMEPCPDAVDDCPLYAADAPYLHAIEVAQGDLPGLGIGPGSVLSFP